MPYQAYVPNFAEAFQAAASMKNARNQSRLADMRLRQEEHAMNLAEQLPKARLEYQLGRPSLLQQLAPQEVSQLRQAEQRQQLQQGQMDVQRRRMELAERQFGQQQGEFAANYADAQRDYQQKRLKAGMEAVSRASTVVERNPQALPAMQRQLAALARQGVVDQEVADQFGQMSTQGLMSMIQQRAKAGATQISVSNQPLTKGTATKLQGELIQNQGILQSLNKIEALARPDYFTMLGRAKNAGSRLVAWVNPEWLSVNASNELRARKVLNNEVEQVFNDVRKAVTGAAAPMAELRMLRNTIINMDQTAPEFQASLQQYKEKVSRIIRLQQRALREGVQVGEVGSRVNQLWQGGEQANSKADVADRTRQLESSGLSDADVVTALLSEGYITQERADIMLGRSR